MTADLQFRLIEVLETALSRDQAQKAVAILEQSIDQQIGASKTVATKEELERREIKLEKQFDKLGDRIDRLTDKVDRMVYWFAGMLLAQTAVIITILKGLSLIK